MSKKLIEKKHNGRYENCKGSRGRCNGWLHSLNIATTFAMTFALIFERNSMTTRKKL